MLHHGPGYFVDTGAVSHRGFFVCQKCLFAPKEDVVWHDRCRGVVVRRVGWRR